MRAILAAWLLLLAIPERVMARDYSTDIAVTKCRDTGSAESSFSWAAEPAKAAAATLALVRPLLANPRGEHAQYATGQPLEQPTREAIQKSFRWLDEEAAEGDRMIVYLATAVVRDAAGNAYLLTDDAVIGPSATPGSRLVKNALSLADLAESVKKLSAYHVFVVLDLCAMDSPVCEAELQAAFGSSPNRCVLAWSADRKAYWEPQGYVTRLAGLLADGLRGAADQDANGHVTQAELVDYLAARASQSQSGTGTFTLAVLGKDIPWEHPLRSAPLDVTAERLAGAMESLLEAKAKKGTVAIVEPTLKDGGATDSPYAKIITQRVAAVLAKRGLSVTTDADQEATVTLSGQLEIRAKPDRLILQWEAKSGGASIGTIRDTVLATPDLADLALPTAQQVAGNGRSAVSLAGTRGAEIEVVDAGPPPRHPHFTSYEGLPITLRFDLCEGNGQNVRDITPIEVGGDCYLPVEKGRCLRIWITRRSETPCAVLPLVDGANVYSLPGLPESARFGTPEEHLANLTYSILDEKRDYTFAEWMNLVSQGEAGQAKVRRFLVTSAPSAVGYRKPGAELGEIRILLYAARTSTQGERSAAERSIGIGAGQDSAMHVPVIRWRADTEVAHTRLVYKYRLSQDIPRTRGP